MRVFSWHQISLSKSPNTQEIFRDWRASSKQCESGDPPSGFFKVGDYQEVSPNNEGVAKDMTSVVIPSGHILPLFQLFRLRPRLRGEAVIQRR